MSSTADDFKKTDEFKQLKLKEKFKSPLALGLFIVEDKTSPCHIRFVSFVEGHKDKSLKTKLTCVILLNRVLHEKKRYEKFMVLFHQAFNTISDNKTWLTKAELQSITECHDAFWDSAKKVPRPLGLPKAV